MRAAAPLAERSLPEWMLQRWRNNLGQKATEFLAEWVNEPAPIIVRANKIRYRAEARTASLPKAKAVPGFPNRSIRSTNLRCPCWTKALVMCRIPARPFPPFC